MSKKEIAIDVLLSLVEEIKVSIKDVNSLSIHDMNPESLKHVIQAVGALALLQSEAKTIQTLLTQFATLFQDYMDLQKSGELPVKVQSKKTYS